MAQTYFAIQTRKQEIFKQFSDNDERLKIRNDITLQNKNLFSTAKKVGVTKFGSFNNSGYQGLYGGMNLSEIENKKDIKKGDLLNRAGATELAANLFRITQTNDIIKNDNILGETQASETHFRVGSKIRKTIQELGGVLPENLPTERPIKELKAEKRRLPRETNKKIKNT
jgi:DNA-damage-inducible protein D